MCEYPIEIHRDGHEHQAAQDCSGPNDGSAEDRPLSGGVGDCQEARRLRAVSASGRAVTCVMLSL